MCGMLYMCRLPRIFSSPIDSSKLGVSFSFQEYQRRLESQCHLNGMLMSENEGINVYVHVCRRLLHSTPSTPLLTPLLFDMMGRTLLVCLSLISLIGCINGAAATALDATTSTLPLMAAVASQCHTA